MRKKTLLIDLDGVLNEYKGSFNAEIIPPPKIGAKEFLEKLSKNFDIKIFTTRNKLLVCGWLLKYELEKYIKDITNIKEVCWLFVDDRCIKFTGDFNQLEKNIDEFKPWYK